MDTLRELVGILAKQKIKHFEALERDQKDSSKTYALFEGIKNGQFQEDRNTADFLYGNNINKEANYVKLKSRLKRKLINAIFFTDLNQPSYNEFQRAYYDCHKDWAAVKVLIGKGARRAAIDIAEKITTKAIKFEFTYLALEASRMLRHHYALINRDKYKYERYNKYVKHYQKILFAELLAEEYHAELAGHFVLSKASKPQIVSIATSYSEELKKVSKDLSSYRLNLFTHLVYVYRYQVLNDYYSMIRVCTEAIDFFEAEKHRASETAIFTFLYKMLACHIQLKQFKQGEKVAKRCLTLFTDKKLNWFFTQELFLILCLHTKKFQAAYEAYLKVRRSKNFDRLYTKSTESWKIYEAYINYFIYNGEIQAAPGHSLKKFRVSKFLNELPMYSKDKRGKNIPILVIHILFLLQQKKYDSVIDRVEAVNQYTYRYLRDDDTYRSNCFIKMLVQLPKANFHKQAVIRKTDKYLAKLRNKPLEISGQSDEIEIVPYEILWDYVLQSLDNKFH